MKISSFGVTLFTVRNDLLNHYESTLEKLSDMGFRYVEQLNLAPILKRDPLFGRDIRTVAKLFERYCLQPTSISLFDNAPLDIQLEYASILGVKQVALGRAKVFVDFSRSRNPFKLPSSQELIQYTEDLKYLSDVISNKGFEFLYHTHDLDLLRIDGLGENTIEYFSRIFDKTQINFQFDLAWLSIAGCDPVSMLYKYRDRVSSIHLKNYYKPLDNEAIQFSAPHEGFMDYASIIPHVIRMIPEQRIFVEIDNSKSPIEELKGFINWSKHLHLLSKHKS